MNRCDCVRILALPQPHLRHIYFNKNLSNQLPHSKLESPFIDCSSKIQWAHPPTLDTTHDKSNDVLFFFLFPAQVELILPNIFGLQVWLESTSHTILWDQIFFKPNKCYHLFLSPLVFLRRWNSRKTGELHCSFCGVGCALFLIRCNA